MSLNYPVTYPGRADPADADYPFGIPRNRVSPGSGTPFDEATQKDIAGFFAASMRQAGITAVNNTPDKVGTSEILQGIARHIAGGSTFYTDTGVADAYVVDIAGALPNIFEGPSVLFDGMEISFYALNSNTGASTIDVEYQGVSIGGVKAIETEVIVALSPRAIDILILNKVKYDASADKWLLIQGANIGLQGNFINYLAFPSSALWTKQPGLIRIKVFAKGPGAGGGGANAGAGQVGLGAGAGEGAEVIAVIEAAALGATENVVIGAGGLGGIGQNAGNSGGVTTFGAHVTANGGVFGNIVVAAVTTSVDSFPGGKGGLGSTTATGQIKNGDCGEMAIRCNGSSSGAGGGDGGGEGIGTGSSNGNDATGPGGGGGGARDNNTASRNGGKGFDGFIGIEEFY